MKCAYVIEEIDAYEKNVRISGRFLDGDGELDDFGTERIPGHQMNEARFWENLIVLGRKPYSFGQALVHGAGKAPEGQRRITVLLSQAAGLEQGRFEYELIVPDIRVLVYRLTEDLHTDLWKLRATEAELNDINGALKRFFERLDRARGAPARKDIDARSSEERWAARGLEDGIRDRLGKEFPISAAMVSYVAGVSLEEWGGGLGHLHAVAEAAILMGCVDPAVVPLTLARRTTRPVPADPVTEEAYAIFRFLRAVNAEGAGPEESAEAPDDPAGRLAEAASRAALPRAGDAGVEIVTGIEAFVREAYRLVGRDVLGVLPSRGRRRVFKAAKLTLGDPLGVVVAVAFLKAWEEQSEILHMSKLSAAYAWKSWLGEPAEAVSRQDTPDRRAGADKAARIDHAWRESLRQLSRAAAAGRADAAVRRFPAWAMTQLVFSDRDLTAPLGCSRRTAARIVGDLCRRNLLVRFSDRGGDILYAPSPIYRLLSSLKELS